MNSIVIKSCLLTSCVVASVLAHVLFFYALHMFGTYDFTIPLRQAQYVEVDLKKATAVDTPLENNKQQGISDPDDVSEDASAEENPAKVSKKEFRNPPVPPEQSQPKLDPKDTPVHSKSYSPSSDVPPQKAPDKTLHSIATASSPPSPKLAREFQEIKNEKLTYLISILDLPVGNAELEAKNINGDILITLRVKSNAAISGFYNVDDLIETRHINGNFIVTRIRQQEGSFRGDRGFTLFLNDLSVFWIDRLTNRSVMESLPNSEVLDILSGMYFLRNRPLQVGTVETLHIYDSESYAAIPVDVIRRETVSLPAFREVEALLVQPQMKTGGIFRRTGDVQIWLSDDRYKVPVKIVTSIALGQVTIELMSAASKQPDNRPSQ